jgi:hypothetical protein
MIAILFMMTAYNSMSYSQLSTQMTAPLMIQRTAEMTDISVNKDYKILKSKKCSQQESASVSFDMIEVPRPQMKYIQSILDHLQDTPFFEHSY